MSSLISWIIPKEMAASPGDPPSLLQEKLANDAPAMRAANSMETEMKGNNAAAQTKKHQHRDLFFFAKKVQVFFVFGGKSQLQKKMREEVWTVESCVD